MGPFTGPLQPVRAAPDHEMSAVDSDLTMTDFMPVLLPLLWPTTQTELTSVKPAPTFDPLNFQPVRQQERDKRRPVRVHQGATASTASDNKKPGQDNPLMMILSFVRQKLQYLNIF